MKENFLLTELTIIERIDPTLCALRKTLCDVVKSLSGWRYTFVDIARAN